MAPDRRKIDRLPTWVDAACHLHGAVRRVRLSDVSNYGCRAEVSMAHITPGDRVMLKLSELLVLPATVVWVSGGQSGLEFASPMQGAMLNQFLLRMGKRRSLH